MRAVTPGDPMTAPVHRELAAGRWHTFTLAQQLGHIGSEVSRSLKWRSRNPDLSRAALERALELFALTLDDPRLRESPARLREVCRAREVLIDFFVGGNEYRSTESQLQRYYDAFAVAAHTERHEP